MSGVDAGHRVLGHTADLIVEAWAPTPERCLEEAVRALVESFARLPAGVQGTSFPIAVRAETADELLVGLLEEVIFLLDVHGSAPVRAALRCGDARAVEGELALVPISALEINGPAPKGVSREGLTFRRDGDRWRALATIDV